MPLAFEAAPSINNERVHQAIWLFLALGIIARLVRFSLRFPLWGDEAALAANFVDATYEDLLEPLRFNQVAPLLFLWIELTFVKLLGFNEYSLRLFSLLSSIGSLFVFRHVAMRLLQGLPLVLAVAIFAVAYPGIRYAAEVKPYGADLLVATILIAITVEWMTRPAGNRWLWILTGAAPVAVGLSFPSVFVAGGLSLAIACVLGTRRTSADWWSWGAFNVSLVASFVALFVLSTGDQATATAEAMTRHWDYSFPPLASPLRFVGWMITTHTGDLLCYPVGGGNGGSTLTFLCCGVGLVVLWRKGWRPGLVLLVAPFLLTFLAAALHRYPYGGHARMTLHLAPAICLLAGSGFAVILMRMAVRHPRRLQAALVALALVGFGSIGRDCWRLGKSKDDLRTRDLSRQLWTELSSGGEVICIGSEVPSSPYYLCNRQIYWRAYAEKEPPQLDRLARDWPLHCVRFSTTQREEDQARFQEWLSRMGSHYRLIAAKQHVLYEYKEPLLRHDRNGQEVSMPRIDHLEVYSFVPKLEDSEGAILTATALTEPRR
jgi:hypothetical protein